VPELRGEVSEESRSPRDDFGDVFARYGGEGAEKCNFARRLKRGEED
jgi:hypothetical protein